MCRSYLPVHISEPEPACIHASGLASYSEFGVSHIPDPEPASVRVCVRVCVRDQGAVSYVDSPSRSRTLCYPGLVLCILILGKP